MRVSIYHCSGLGKDNSLMLPREPLMIILGEAHSPASFGVLGNGTTRGVRNRLSALFPLSPSSPPAARSVRDIECGVPGRKSAADEFGD